MTSYSAETDAGRTARETDVAVATDVDAQWWKEAVVYQIYPRSFNDSNGDGIGDIPGILEKVDYLDDLGVDVVWLCPVYDSPNADNGYDIRDFQAIMDEFGDMGDWERLLDALHDRDIRLIMDLVLNHTAKDHDWFQRSRRREESYADYYYWRDGDPEEPPNNWESIFGGSAWSYDEERGQWYLHLFDENQPDLNWRNPAVRQSIASVVEWWLERGIDGFRMDAISHISKTDGLPDGDPGNSPVGSAHYSHGPRLREYLRELYEETLGDYDVMTVGEMGMTSVEQAADYCGPDGVGLDMVFLFDHLGVGDGARWDPDDAAEWDLPEFKSVVSRKQAELDWDALFLGNHDQPRIVSTFGDEDAYRFESATLLATFLLTMRGTPYVYQGEELGMTNADFESLDEVDDPMTVGKVEELIADGVVDSFEEIRHVVNAESRDHGRTPMHWSADANAGFTDGDPWLRVNDDFDAINVADARGDEDSVWQHYRRLIDLRHDEDVLVYGEYDLLCPEDEDIYAYTRTLGETRVLVVLNWSAEPTTFESDAVATADAEHLYGNYADSPADLGGATLRPWEAVVSRL